MTRYDRGAYLIDNLDIVQETEGRELAMLCGSYIPSRHEAKKGTIAYSILESHNTSGDTKNLKLKFDALTSHDITFVGIIQTAKASGLKAFPVPYVLTNCHNSLCAVGGTINEDDHVFGLTAAKKYGGIFVPPHMAVIHQYMREMMAGGGKMILGSDSHTRYGAIGTMAIGEGGGELVKQLLCQTYDITYPDVVGVYLSGKPGHGVGPQDVAIALIREVFESGFVKNKVLEFMGPGIAHLSMDYRNGIDVMTTETACLSSIWQTDEKTREYLTVHGRGAEYKKLEPQRIAYYDKIIEIDLSEIKPMIALPFHPSAGYTIEEFRANAADILKEIEERAVEVAGAPIDLLGKLRGGELYVDQGIIAGCAGGGYENLMLTASILNGSSTGVDEFGLSIYPASQPIMVELTKKGATQKLLQSGAIMRTAFCGPCFGAGDTPSNNALSIRHTTRNFPNREGSKPGQGQIAAVALMDARSIAATALNGGKLTSANEIDFEETVPDYVFDETSYKSRVYYGWGSARAEEEIKYGPNIKDWPEMMPLPVNLLLRVDSLINDPVTTTDELIPSGETSSYRSNPMGLAEFTLSRRDPSYVGRAKETASLEKGRREGTLSPALENAISEIKVIAGNQSVDLQSIGLESMIYAIKPGDGSAREQAASCQRVLGGGANIASEYATKRYRSNLINWGMVPFTLEGKALFDIGDYIFVPKVRTGMLRGDSDFKAYILGKNIEMTLQIGEMTDTERNIIAAGSLINYNRLNGGK